MASIGNMCFRSLARISRLSPSLLVRSPKSRGSNVYMSTTTAETSARPADPGPGQKEDDPASVEQPSKAQIDFTEEKKKLQATFTEEKKKLQEEIKDFKEKYMRSLAETENVRQRMRKQIEEAKIFGIQGFCKDLLEVADILGKATESVPQDQLTNDNLHLKNLYEGLIMTEGMLQKVFTKHGVCQISPSEGEKFDPFIHEAVCQVPTQDKANGTVAVVQTIGYKLQERTVRPAVVGVFKST